MSLAEVDLTDTTQYQWLHDAFGERLHRAFAVLNDEEQEAAFAQAQTDAGDTARVERMYTATAGGHRDVKYLLGKTKRPQVSFSGSIGLLGHSVAVNISPVEGALCCNAAVSSTPFANEFGANTQPSVVVWKLLLPQEVDIYPNTTAQINDIALACIAEYAVSVHKAPDTDAPGAYFLREARFTPY